MTRAPSPAIRRRELGTRLRAHREAAGLTLDEVADRLLVSSTKISRLETAARGVNLRDVRDLAALYQLPDAEVDVLMRLARESREASSWQQYENRISDYAELEEAATAIYDFESTAVPALLQSERYARAVAIGVDPGATDAKRRDAVRARLARQRSMQEHRQTFSAILDEAALHRVVGGKDVMHEQMGVLLARARLPNVTIRIIPYEVGAHPGMDSTFILLRFEESVSDLVYVEGLIGSIYLKSPGDVERYERVFDRLQQMSLTKAGSLDKIRSLAQYYRP